MSLDGIGEVRADAIIRARPFKVKTELVERRLIPEALYEKINARVIVKPVPTPVTLAQIKAEPKLQNLALVRQSRLSVVPVGEAEWKLICKMGGL